MPICCTDLLCRYPMPIAYVDRLCWYSFGNLFANTMLIPYVSTLCLNTMRIQYADYLCRYIVSIRLIRCANCEDASCARWNTLSSNATETCSIRTAHRATRSRRQRAHSKRTPAYRWSLAVQNPCRCLLGRVVSNAIRHNRTPCASIERRAARNADRKVTNQNKDIQTSCECIKRAAKGERCIPVYPSVSSRSSVYHSVSSLFVHGHTTGAVTLLVRCLSARTKEAKEAKSLNYIKG